MDAPTHQPRPAQSTEQPARPSFPRMKIISLYPQLKSSDFDLLFGGTIHLQNDSDGKGDYIAKWEHPTLAQPTKEQLDGISS